MTNIVDALQYYFRVFTNINWGSGSVLGIFHLTAIVGVLTMIFLLILATMVARADKSAKNRFMTLMLITEGFTAGFLTLYWLYPWPMNALPYLYPFRLFLGFLGMQRAVLFLTAPTFYIDRPWAKKISGLYGGWGILLAPALGLLILSVFFMGKDDYITAGGDMFTIYCAGIGEGLGATYSGRPLPYKPYCPESLAEVYPIYITSVGVGTISSLVIGFQLMVNITSTIIMTLLARAHRKSSNPTVDLNEIRAMSIGFQVKVIFNITSFAALILLMVYIGRPSPETSVFNKSWADTEMAKIFFVFMPIAISPYIAANLIEGVVFTYAIIKHDLMGIDERLRKTFTATVFAGLGGLSFLMTTELMENVVGAGWIGGVLIGVVFIAVRKPILKVISRVTSAMMPEALSTVEQTYIDLYKIAMEDNVITIKERAMLNLHAKTNGITPKRATMLEENFNRQHGQQPTHQSEET